VKEEYDPPQNFTSKVIRGQENISHSFVAVNSISPNNRRENRMDADDNKKKPDEEEGTIGWMLNQETIQEKIPINAAQ